jgi:hypothetical protein
MMTNPKARAATERFAVFENPEISAMAAICEILQELPDEAARLRVMHWAFGRFSPDFKRPAPVAAPQPVMTAEIAAVAPEVAAPPAAAAPRDEDFGRQISELRDLFGGDGRRPARSLYADAF